MRNRAQTREQKRLSFYAGLMCSDAVCIALAYAIPTSMRPSIGLHLLTLCMLLIPLYLVAAIDGHVYTIQTLRRWQRGAIRGIRAFVYALLVAAGLLSIFKLGRLPPSSAILQGGAVALLLLVASRRAAAAIARHFFEGEPVSQAVLVDGDAYRIPPAKSYAVIDAARLKLEPSFDPLMLDRIGRTIAPYDRITILCAPDSRRRWSEALKGSGRPIEVVMPELAELRPLGAGRHEIGPTLLVADTGLALRERVVKRMFDLIVSGTGLLAASPVLVIAAIWVKLDSKGPVIFRQNRVGQGNRLFACYKFRTMYTECADASASRLTTRNDDRVTRVGAILRHTSLDELPQLWNVIRGDMSLVGPRPHALGATAGDALYWEVDNRYFDRHAAKPGLTGLAQVRGFRGNTETADDLINRLQADLEYLRDWSIWKDAVIIMKTLRVLVHANAF